MQETAARQKSYPTVDVSRCTGCLNCRLICSITYEDQFNPARARLTVDAAKGRTLRIGFREDCTKCGLCARHCLYGALTVHEER